MKTTSKKSLEKRIEKLVNSKKVNKTSILYGWLKELKEGKKEFRPVYSSGGSWKHSSLFDRTIELTTVLNALKIEYKLSNDAPKGGKTGALITIITKVKQN